MNHRIDNMESKSERGSALNPAQASVFAGFYWWWQGSLRRCALPGVF